MAATRPCRRRSASSSWSTTPTSRSTKLGPPLAVPIDPCCSSKRGRAPRPTQNLRPAGTSAVPRTIAPWRLIRPTPSSVACFEDFQSPGPAHPPKALRPAEQPASHPAESRRAGAGSCSVRAPALGRPAGIDDSVSHDRQLGDSVSDLFVSAVGRSPGCFSAQVSRARLVRRTPLCEGFSHLGLLPLRAGMVVIYGRVLFSAPLAGREEGAEVVPSAPLWVRGIRRRRRDRAAPICALNFVPFHFWTCTGALVQIF